MAELVSKSAVREIVKAGCGKGFGSPVKLACIPYSVPNGELVRVVIHFMDQHPELLHWRLPALAIAALAEAWSRPLARYGRQT